MDNFNQHYINEEQHEYICELINGRIYIFLISVAITNGVLYKFKAGEQYKDKFGEFK